MNSPAIRIHHQSCVSDRQQARRRSHNEETHRLSYATSSPLLTTCNKRSDRGETHRLSGKSIGPALVTGSQKEPLDTFSWINLEYDKRFTGF